jgi:diaminohydroxyphosphoribosylaminopyrimidine deaminase/5-amino-6-(5-phosphoribosylamino)uracil reductase
MHRVNKSHRVGLPKILEMCNDAARERENYAMGTSGDIQYLDRAVELARNGLGQTAPNPPVGAVIFADGRIIGEGWHQGAGLPHAEINAISSVRDSLPSGAAMAVTLEPCCHTGKTPPCTSAIIEAGISTVIFGELDPDSRVAGKGAQALRDAGINVRHIENFAPALELLRFYKKWQTTGTPWVTLKIAQTLDGRIAARDGSSRWITGDASRQRVHQMRAQHDAVLVGSSTAIQDNPRLNVRDAAGKDPLRVVLDSRLRIPLASHLVEDGAENTIVFTAERQLGTPNANHLIAEGVRVFPVAECAGGLNLKEVLNTLGTLGCHSVLVEGGRGVYTSFIENRLVDEYAVFVSPRIMGEGISAIGDIGVQSMEQVQRFSHFQVEQIGSDLLMRGSGTCLQD